MTIEAEGKYREAWLEYLKNPTQELEEAMDLLQLQIANTPKDPRWIDFIRSLPGYNDFWQQSYQTYLRMLNQGIKNGE